MSERGIWSLIVLVLSQAAFAFDPGETVYIKNDALIAFKDQFYRQARKGEKIVVYQHNRSAGRVYFIGLDSQGRQIGLNISEDALTTIDPTAATEPETSEAAPTKVERSLSFSEYKALEVEMGKEWDALRNDEAGAKANVTWLMQIISVKPTSRDGWNVLACWVSPGEKSKCKVAVIQTGNTAINKGVSEGDWIVVKGYPETYLPGVADLKRDGIVGIHATEIQNFGYRRDSSP